MKTHLCVSQAEIKHDGDYAFDADMKQIYIKIPLVGMCAIPLGDGSDIAWQFNGTRECPTLNPSLDCEGGVANGHWHGWLVNGELKEC